MDDLTPVRVLVVDDDALVRSGLAMILGGAPDLLLVGQAANGREALAAAREHRPDVVLLDVRMPVMNGLEATEHLLSWPAPPRVLVLTTFHEDEYVVRALAAGASGFLLKDTPPADIVEAVHRVAAGVPVLSPDVTARLIDKVAARDEPRRASQARERLERLTGREQDVARAIGRGLNNADIARELHLSVPTVKAHVGRVLDKLGAQNRVQVAICVHDAGWL